MKFKLDKANWIFQPKTYLITDNSLEITTEPETDFWQRTYYGFRNDNSPGLLYETEDNFSFTVKTSFNYKTMFDQCGLLIYIDSDNWVKAGLEYENESISRLGSVVTNLGYSDWATTDIENQNSLYYRLNRRGPDFLIESSLDGYAFTQMRIFHLHVLGKTTEAMGKGDAPLKTGHQIRFGFYASSPGESSFTARFSEIKLEACRWKAH